jgi:hypothetical protein
MIGSKNFRAVSLRLAPITKKGLDHCSTAFFAHSFYDVDLMIESGILPNLVNAFGSAPFGVERPEYQGFHTGVDNGAHAHGAGLDRNIQRGA